ncbi:uncharacterized protein [Zea mays]|uniref:uncharacterized protein isoform X1 n=1 Tax=Zea mays TaxID=4577 RepID=UPI000C6C4092|nr:uncharacterized protein LOC100277351 isoform X1 [Zea mays]XP_023157626.1 uncharacterized protein LOC100277351 isoform X1 [Zea mays]XP_023157627.1 uncharacterized protein LOC100277351 isoform X1 [Zea mays]|eukprot:XP_023157625.1 uncharacterized protein LOC100277351 isoform X1 [Zea mays]
MRARNVCVASVDLFSQNSAVATAAREDGIQCVTLLTYLAAAQIYRTNRSRHYRVMVLDNAHHSTPAGVSCSAADGVRDLDLAKASVDTVIWVLAAWGNFVATWRRTIAILRFRSSVTLCAYTLDLLRDNFSPVLCDVLPYYAIYRAMPDSPCVRVARCHEAKRPRHSAIAQG